MAAALVACGRLVTSSNVTAHLAGALGALESSNAANVRVDKIYSIMRESKFGIHDISRTSLDGVNKLPRFNMPLELGVFLGAKQFGDNFQRQKNCLILDREKYRYMKFCSDISGQDIGAHKNNGDVAIEVARNWLSTVRPHPKGFIPSGRRLAKRYEAFQRYLPKACRRVKSSVKAMTFMDFRMIVAGWIKVHPW